LVEGNNSSALDHLKMLLFKDIFNEKEELFTDVQIYKEIFAGCLYEVQGKLISRTDKGIDDSLIGGNASAEGNDGEGVDDATNITGFDIVINNRLFCLDSNFGKKEYVSYIKAYIKRIISKMEDIGDEDRIEAFKANANDAVKNFFLPNIRKFDSWYTSENAITDSKEDEIMYIPMLISEGDDGEEIYTFYFWKNGTVEEKC